MGTQVDVILWTALIPDCHTHTHAHTHAHTHVQSCVHGGLQTLTRLIITEVIAGVCWRVCVH